MFGCDRACPKTLVILVTKADNETTYQATLGRVKLKTLTPEHVRDLYREKLAAGLSARTVQYVHVTLHRALKQAVADGLIPRNASEAVKTPRPSKKEIRPLSSEQSRAFLQAVAKARDRFEALYVLAVHCAGCGRAGELLALKWEDIDLEAGKLAVRRSLSETKEKGHVFEAPKNVKGRSIKLTSGETEALKRHRKRQLEERMRFAGLYEDQGLVFLNQTGKTMNVKNLTARSYKPLLKSMGLSATARLQDLRHTFAAVLLSRGVHPALVQKLRAHRNISITLDTYSHTLPGMGDAAAGEIDEATG